MGDGQSGGAAGATGRVSRRIVPTFEPRTPNLMHLDELRDACLALPHATEDLPFGPDTLVFRVGGKMFALLGLEREPPFVNLKCDPERAVDLRERYAGVTAGYHMNKRHWNSVALRGDVPRAEVEAQVRHSYDLVLASLTRAQRAALGA